MTFEQFDKFTEDFINKVRGMKDTKGKEYAHSSDRFDNFNRLASRLGISRVVILQIYLTKHLDAIDSYLTVGKVYSGEPIEGRIVDAVTYLILLAGMIHESEGMLAKNKTEEIWHIYEGQTLVNRTTFLRYGDLVSIINYGAISSTIQIKDTDIKFNVHNENLKPCS